MDERSFQWLWSSCRSSETACTATYALASGKYCVQLVALVAWRRSTEDAGVARRSLFFAHVCTQVMLLPERLGPTALMRAQPRTSVWGRKRQVSACISTVGGLKCGAGAEAKIVVHLSDILRHIISSSTCQCEECIGWSGFHSALA